MVAKTPPTKEKMRLVAALNPNLVRETVNKVDRCMARLQELQYTVTGGAKVISGVSLSPRSTRGYLRTSLRCKQESLRMKTGGARKSPTKTQENTTGEWRRMSLPAMLLDETVLEILQASKFAKEVVGTAAKLSTTRTKCDPKTPILVKRNRKVCSEDNTELRARRIREKQDLRRTVRSECGSPVVAKARSQIKFKPKTPPSRMENRCVNTKAAFVAQRASPKNWTAAKKTVLFPNPLFLSSTTSPSSSRQQKFYKVRSPIIARTKKPQTPHKFLVKTPPSSLKSQFKSKKAIQGTILFSPSEKKVVAPKARRCSFSPSKLASRLVSPLKNRISPLKARNALQKTGSQLLSGLKQRPMCGSPMRAYPSRRARPPTLGLI